MANLLSTKNVAGSPWTTIVGILIPVVLTLLVLFKVITVEQQDPLNNLLEQLIAAIAENKLAAIISVAVSILLIFIKDPKAE